jgi:maltose/moltooligosaccharide transporter
MLGEVKSHPAHPREPGTPSAKIYTVGTLKYDQRALVILFFWLMWNDFSYFLIEGVSGVGQFLMRDQGATFTQMAMIGSIGFFLPWINPIVSTWSDRHRGKWGRRRPFLFFATPFFAFFLAIYPYMPTFYHWLLRFPWFVGVSHHFPMKGPIIFLAVCSFISNLFNAVMQAIFSYLYWDVVPESHMGRFQSLSKNVTLLSGLFCSFVLFALAEHHLKAVYVGTAFFCAVVYLVSVWQIKEGEYPPPDRHKKGGLVAPVRAYFVECFGERYYVWVFVASLLVQFGNAGNTYQNYYLHYDLKMDLVAIGLLRGWTNVVTVGFGAICGFAIGTMTDRLKPVRLMGSLYLLQAILFVASFYLVHNYRTALISACVVSVVQFAQGVVIGAFTVEIFPREKLGQFCSAQAVFYQFTLHLAGPFIGMFYDHLNNNRFGFFWQGGFFFLAAIAYIKVYLNWKERRGRTPVPHAG